VNQLQSQTSNPLWVLGVGGGDDVDPELEAYIASRGGRTTSFVPTTPGEAQGVIDAWKDSPWPQMNSTKATMNGNHFLDALLVHLGGSNTTLQSQALGTIQHWVKAGNVSIEESIINGGGNAYANWFNSNMPGKFAVDPTLAAGRTRMGMTTYSLFPQF
jgi:hypothetical protein